MCHAGRFDLPFICSSICGCDCTMYYSACICDGITDILNEDTFVCIHEIQEITVTNKKYQENRIMSCFIADLLWYDFTHFVSCCIWMMSSDEQPCFPHLTQFPFRSSPSAKERKYSQCFYHNVGGDLVCLFGFHLHEYTETVQAVFYQVFLVIFIQRWNKYSDLALK